MARRTQQAPVLIDLPLSASFGGDFADILASSTDHAKFFADGFKAGWASSRQNSVQRRNDVRLALIAKYNLHA